MTQNNTQQKQEEKKIEGLSIAEKLSLIQNEMNVPKNIYNKFGNYYYRNAETILEAAKPVCKKYRTTLIVFDNIEFIEGRFYVKAIANLINWDSNDTIVNTSFAREEESKKGMDGSQVTGSASSYARKYALNGLFNLDDVKDGDSNEQREETKAKSAQVPKEQKDITNLIAEVEILTKECASLSINLSSKETDDWLKKHNDNQSDPKKMGELHLEKYKKCLRILIDGKKQKK